MNMTPNLFPQYPVTDLVPGLVGPAGRGDPNAPYGPNTPAVEAFLARVHAATEADIARVAEAFDDGSSMGWHRVHHYEADLTEAARRGGLVDAVQRAFFDGVMAAVEVSGWNHMNAEYFFEFFWNSRTEANFTEAAGLAAVALTLGSQLPPVTAAELSEPWQAVLEIAESPPGAAAS